MTQVSHEVLVDRAVDLLQASPVDASLLSGPIMQFVKAEIAKMVAAKRAFTIPEIEADLEAAGIVSTNWQAIIQLIMQLLPIILAFFGM
jgi:hypothetical protein